MDKVSSYSRRLLYILLKTSYDRNINKVRYDLDGGKKWAYTVLWYWLLCCSLGLGGFFPVVFPLSRQI